MILLTNEEIEQLPDLYSTENAEDQMCQIKFFTPDSSWSWFVTEISHSDKVTCFGYVVGQESELGYFNLDELSNVKGPLGLNIERDKSFTPTLLSEVKRGNQ